jgi:hypothetical protein
MYELRRIWFFVSIGGRGKGQEIVKTGLLPFLLRSKI